MARLLKKHLRQIDLAVDEFEKVRDSFFGLAQGIESFLTSNPDVSSCTHFVKHRVKDADHLKKKLIRKAMECLAENKDPDIGPHNVLTAIDDLMGIRILHLHTEQIKQIDKGLRAVFNQQQLKLKEKPTAKCWDTEYEKFYRDIGFAVDNNTSMYTSVHYVIQINQTNKFTCEIQVRTMMDEAWGEVSHSIDYPEPTKSRVCKDQLRVLARLTSGCVRLTDSIMTSDKESKAT